MSPLPPPAVTREGEALRSDAFGDIYYQEADGLAETRHVFLDGNDLTARFSAIEKPTPFVIGELGFGTGLNFLAAALAFETHAPPGARLDYWSAEGFPFPPAQFGEILGAIADRWPELSGWAKRLGDAYPAPRPGQTYLQLTDHVTLTLGLGPALETLKDAQLAADAWFLDGFSPAQNPDMWSPELMAEVASHTRPGGSFATFTVAGAVRRGLAEAGFAIEKHPGFGKKREMLAGTREGENEPRPAITRVGIIGAGIAGACAAHTAMRAGLDVTIFDPSGPASGASGNPAGLLMPRIEAQDNAAARFYRDAFFFARRFYDRECPEAVVSPPAAMRGDPVRFARVLETGLWAVGDFKADGDRLHPAQGALLVPGEAVRTLIDKTPLLTERVTAIAETDTGVIVTCGLTEYPFDAVVIAAGPQSANLLDLEADMSASRGQVDVFDGPLPEGILTDSTYIAPFRGKLIAGATYDPASPDDRPLPDDPGTATNRDAAETMLGQKVGDALDRRAALRATTRDRHPVAGPSRGDDESRIFALSGLGSRGLVTAPLLARDLIARMLGGVSPVTAAERSILAPGRFEERRRRRGQVVTPQ